MDKNRDNKEKFDRYYRNEMSADEAKDFKAQLQVDEEIRKYYENYLIEISAIHYFARKQLIEGFQEKKSKKFKIKHFLSIAAAIALLITGVIATYKEFNENDYQDIFISYYQKEESLTFQRARGSGSAYEILNEAYALYLKGNYHAGLSELMKIEQADQNPKALYLQGLINLELNNNKEAIQLFISALDFDSSITEEVKWYLALTYLDMGDKNKSIEVLSEIYSDKYKEKSLKLIKELQEEE